MQTPTGYALNAAGQYVPADWWSIVFNPSFPYRLVHMVLAAYLTTALVVGATAAWHLLRSRANEEVRIMFSMAMWMFAIVAPIQIVAGDMHGLNTLEHQPTKVMAMEGHFQSHPNGAPLVLFGFPDQGAGKVDYAVEVPKLSSLILKHELDAPLAGLDSVPRQDWPPVAIVFWSFRVMVGLGFLMLGLGLASLYALAQNASQLAMATLVRVGHGSRRLRRRAGRLDYDGGRPAAFHDLWAPAHDGIRLAPASLIGRHIPAGLRPDLLHRVRDGCPVHFSPHGASAKRGRVGPRRGRSDP
jgi:cytochrome bd-type quinol oxidase subunit 1